MEAFSFKQRRFDRLAARMRSGDEEAARTLYRELMGKVYGFCMSRVRDQMLAEDLTQDIFVKLVDHIDSFDGKKGGFLVWFWKIAHHTVIDHYRRAREVPFSRLKNEGDENLEESLVWGEGPEALVEGRLAISKIETLLGTFSADDQELFRLRYVADLSYKEIAGILGRHEGALRVATSRLKKKLADHLKHEHT